MKIKNTELKLNLDSFKEMCDVMEKYGDSDMPFGGKNEDGENVLVSVYYDRIVIETFQSNGWTRFNSYWKDGTREEWYEK